MPSVAQPFINGVEFGHKDKLGEPVRTGFTAVNGRGSPPQHKTNGVNGTNGMPASDTINVTPISRNSSEEQDRKIPVPQREDWQYSTTNGHGHRIVTPPNGAERPSTGSPGKRKLSDSEEEANGYHTYESSTSQARRRVASYDSVQEDDSPNTVSHSVPVSIEHTTERSGSTWQPRQRAESMNDSQFAEALQRDSRQRDSRSMESEDRNGSPDGGSMTADGDTRNQGDRSSTTELTRAGVQVDPKKRKRQFANRTKTGCQTCRRRKKKCDEAKPELIAFAVASSAKVMRIKLPGRNPVFPRHTSRCKRKTGFLNSLDSITLMVIPEKAIPSHMHHHMSTELERDL
ncbi:uncharacterized protein BDZ99DRAFT_28939 [Mytilinidion resinicola]|uniref:Zn(2)-C6 fungal-type domain-containing protein n=1 Tax=Mytilinidion resinicola TaxID=574789 RepID=A0A6A6YKS2_9PEZI|nr:uncharacterized protein BDZ99DRAFT_28939 [Mytilinidion resinicola]KAF2809466.1 hypothetical protein BDZ99DRAFT_28939 [Mytilinidion resinicola]